MPRKRPLEPLQFVEPMECKAVDKLPSGSEWTYELKLDGYRAQVLHDADSIRILSKNGNDLTARFPATTAALREALPIGTAVDGELVAFDEHTRPSFSAIQNAYGPSAYVVFYAFDLLTVAGQSVLHEPLAKRKMLLAGIYKASELADLCPSFPGESPDRFLRSVREVHGEGAVAKRSDGAYEPGQRTGKWRKHRINTAQEFVIGGFTRGTDPFDAVLVGFYCDMPKPVRIPPRRGQYVTTKKELIFCASVRNGFVSASRRALFTRMHPLATEQCPFVNLPEKSGGQFGQGLTAAKMLNCVWLRPELVAQFEFLNWTPAAHLRHACYLGVREDKRAIEVVRET